MTVQKNGREIFNDSDINNPDIDGGTIDNTTIGGTTPNTGAFTTATASEMALVDPDVAHGMTTLASTDTFGRLAPISGTIGGLDITGLTDATQDGALRMTGVIGAADPTDTHAAVHLRGGKANGTGWQAVAAAETVLRLSNYTTDLITVLGNGNVGIGTTAPQAPLDVIGGGSRSFVPTAGQAQGIFQGVALSRMLLVAPTASILNFASLTDEDIGGIDYTHSTNLMSFRTNNVSDRMVINSSGNVGIGTTGPTHKLDVNGAIKIYGQNTVHATSALVIGQESSTKTQLRAYGSDASTPGSFEFMVSASDGTNITTAMTILGSGNVGIGTTDLDGTPAVGVLTVKGTTTDGSTLIFVGRDSAEANVITVDTDGDILNSAGVYGTISDEKLKTNIKDATAKLSDILKVKVRHFNLKNKPDLKQLGVVAQELETVFPGMVTSTPDMERVPDTAWIPKTLKRQMTETMPVEKPKTEIIEIDGKYVQKTIIETVEETVQLFDEVFLYDESGEMLMQMVSPAKEAVLDEEGNEIEPAVEAVYAPVIHRIPRMEEYTETEDQRPMIVQPTGTVTKSVKTSVFIPMLIKAVQELTARVEDLEKRK